jgi:hypothetical protein
MNIAGKGKKVVGFVHNITLESSLKKVSMAAVTPVVIHGISSQEAAYEFG